MTEQAPILTVVIPLIAAFLCPVLGMWRKGLCYVWTIGALLSSFLFSVVTLMTVLEKGTIHYRLGGWPPPFGIEYVVDHLNAMMLVIMYDPEAG